MSTRSGMEVISKTNHECHNKTKHIKSNREKNDETEKARVRRREKKEEKKHECGKGFKRFGENERLGVRTDSVVNCIALCILQYNYSPSKKHLKAIIKMKMLAPFE